MSHAPLSLRPYSPLTRLSDFFDLRSYHSSAEVPSENVQIKSESTPDNAHVSFTHFGKTEDTYPSSVMAGFVRHMALPSIHNGVDCILPVLLWDTKLCEHVVTGVLIQFLQWDKSGTPDDYGVDQEDIGKKAEELYTRIESWCIAPTVY
jgi:hypothetical protein